MGTLQSGPLGPADPDDAFYAQAFPYYAEVSALTGIAKKPGIGVKLHSGIGGHTLLYLNGVRRDRSAGYPTLKLCDPDETPRHQGVGLSVNSHFRNANWVAADGPDFLWYGARAPGERLTRAVYERTQERAKALGVLDGIEFHDHWFRNKPPGMTKRDFMYEISIATDYAAQFGRDILRARVPLDRARMAAMVAFLNELNAPYRDGKKVFNWRVLNDNCAHAAHNALARAGIWAPWPTGQFFAFAAFNFPVPKNEFVDLVLRTNDLPIDDPDALYEDAMARRALLESGALPTAPGALARFVPAVADNELYNIDRLRIIFYDNPFWGPYRPWLKRILREPRYADLRANLRHFESLYAAALQKQRGAVSAARAAFQSHYERYIAQEAAKVSALLARLDRVPERQAALT